MPMVNEPAGEDAQDQSQGQGGIAEAIVQTDKNLSLIAQATTKNPQIPDELKAAAQGALDAFRQFADGLSQLMGGQGGQPQGPTGAVAPEQGGNAGAVPMNMAKGR